MATAEFPHAAAPRVPAAPSPDADLLSSNLERLAARRNALAMRRAIVRALVPAIAVSALGVLAYRFFLIDGEMWMPIALIVLALGIGYRNGRLAGRGAFAAAVDADEKLGLNDEIASALAFSRPDAVRRAQSSNASKSDWKARASAILFPRLHWQTSGAALPTAFVPALISDAARRSTQIEAKTLYPNAFDRAHKVLCVAAILLLGFALMPDNMYFLSAAQKQLTKTMQAQGAELQQIAKKVQKKNDAATSEKTRALARRLEALGRKMGRGRMTKKSALVGLGQLKRDMERANQNDRSAPSNDTARMEEALRNGTYESPALQEAQRELKAEQREAAAQALEKLAEKAEKGQLTKQEKEQAAGDLEKAAQQLRKQGGQANEQAAQQLEEAAKALREQNQQQQAQQGQKPGQQGDGGQQPQGKNGQQQSQPGQQGKQPQGKNGQQQQSGQNGQKSGQQQSGKNGQQQQGSQSGQQSGQQQGAQQGQKAGQQSGQGQQSQGGGQSGESGQSGGDQGAANALRGMANGLRGSSGGGQSVRDMMKKIEDAENQTGSNSGSQSGQGKAGGNCIGGNCNGDGKMMTPGKDIRASDPTKSPGGGGGLGPRNNIQGGQKMGGGTSQFRTRRTGDKRRWGDVWSDRLPKTRSKIDRITGKMGSQGEAEQLSTRTEARSGAVKTPYYDVYESYKKDAEDAISREAVPPAYKAPVKDYFDSLKP